MDQSIEFAVKSRITDHDRDSVLLQLHFSDLGSDAYSQGAFTASKTKRHSTALTKK